MKRVLALKCAAFQTYRHAAMAPTFDLRLDHVLLRSQERLAGVVLEQLAVAYIAPERVHGAVPGLLRELPDAGAVAGDPVMKPERSKWPGRLAGSMPARCARRFARCATPAAVSAASVTPPLPSPTVLMPSPRCSVLLRILTRSPSGTSGWTGPLQISLHFPFEGSESAFDQFAQCDTMREFSRLIAKAFLFDNCMEAIMRPSSNTRI